MSATEKAKHFSFAAQLPSLVQYFRQWRLGTDMSVPMPEQKLPAAQLSWPMSLCISLARMQEPPTITFPVGATQRVSSVMLPLPSSTKVHLLRFGSMQSCAIGSHGPDWTILRSGCFP